MINIINECRNNLSFDPNIDFSIDTIKIYLILTRRCNCNCEYCYQNYNFRANLNMSIKVADYAIAFAKNTFNKKIVFNLFGGEPLLNKDTFKHLVNKKDDFYVTTNGIEIIENNCIRDIIKKNANIKIIFSPIALKNYYGKDLFLDKIKEIIDLAGNRAIINFVLYDPSDYIYVDNIIKCKPARFDISLVRESLKLEDEKQLYIEALKNISDVIFINNIDSNLKLMLNKKDNVYRYLSGLELLSKCKGFFCGAGYTKIAIDYNGDLYPCDYAISFNNMKMGSIYEGIINKDMMLSLPNNWKNEIGLGCKSCILGDPRLCSQAMCSVYSYRNNENIFIPDRGCCIYSSIVFETKKYIYDKYYRKMEEVNDDLDK